MVNYQETPKWNEEVLKFVSVARSLSICEQHSSINIYEMDRQRVGVWIISLRHVRLIHRVYFLVFNHVYQIGGTGTIEKSLNAVRYAGWIHVIGFLAGVCRIC